MSKEIKIKTNEQAILLLMSALENCTNFDARSKVNKSLTRQQSWDIFMGGCQQVKDEGKRIHRISAKNIWKEFGEYWVDSIDTPPKS